MKSCARAALAAVREHDPAAAGLADRVAELAYLTTDLGTDLAGYASGVDADPSRLAEVDARRAELAPLLRSHGDLPAAGAWAVRSRARLDELEDDGLPQRLREQVAAAEAELAALAERVHASRAGAAGRVPAAWPSAMRCSSTPLRSPGNSKSSRRADGAEADVRAAGRSPRAASLREGSAIEGSAPAVSFSAAWRRLSMRSRT